MKAFVLATAGVLALTSASPVGDAKMAHLDDVFSVLTLNMTERPPALLELMARSISSLDVGEAVVLDDAWSDAAGILQLADLPPEFLGDLTLRQLGAIYGTHITDIDAPVMIAALTLGGAPIASSRSRSPHR